MYPILRHVMNFFMQAFPEVQISNNPNLFIDKAPPKPAQMVKVVSDEFKRATEDRKPFGIKVEVDAEEAYQHPKHWVRKHLENTGYTRHGKVVPDKSIVTNYGLRILLDEQEIKRMGITKPVSSKYTGSSRE